MDLKKEVTTLFAYCEKLIWGYVPLDGLCLEFFPDFSNFFCGGSSGQIIYKEYIVFRGSNISCSLARRRPTEKLSLGVGSDVREVILLETQIMLVWLPPINTAVDSFFTSLLKLPQTHCNKVIKF